MTDEIPPVLRSPMSRRSLLRMAGAGAVAAGALPLL